jgi:hypothetical protein
MILAVLFVYFFEKITPKTTQNCSSCLPFRRNNSLNVPQKTSPNFIRAMYLQWNPCPPPAPASPWAACPRMRGEHSLRSRIVRLLFRTKLFILPKFCSNSNSSCLTALYSPNSALSSFFCSSLFSTNDRANPLKTRVSATFTQSEIHLRSFAISVSHFPRRTQPERL